MEGIRQAKVSRLIQKEVATLLQLHHNTWCLGHLVTVTVVRTSADLMDVKVYLSVFPPEKAKITHQNLVAILPEIRLELGKKVKKSLRRVPNLLFYIDDSLDYAGKIDELLKK